MIRRPNDEETKYSIGNVDNSSMSGSHWISYYKEPNRPTLIYDSFGRDSSVLLPAVVKVLKEWNDTQYDVEQLSYQANCGALCMGWLLFAKRFGYENAKLI